MADHKLTTEYRRLAILKHLARAASYTSNGSILLDVVNGAGVATTRDPLISALAWLDELDEQELIAITDHGEFIVATVNQRGVEVAEGQVVHPCVKRPSAGL